MTIQKTLIAIKKNYGQMEVAIEAIEARIKGEWNNPALMSFGELSTNTEEDILRIIKETNEIKAREIT